MIYIFAVVVVYMEKCWMHDSWFVILLDEGSLIGMVSSADVAAPGAHEGELVRMGHQKKMEMRGKCADCFTLTCL